MIRHPALRRAVAALRGVAATLVRAPRRKAVVAARMAKLAPIIAPLLARDPRDGVLPFPSQRTQTVLRSGIVKTRRDKPVQGPR